MCSVSVPLHGGGAVTFRRDGIGVCIGARTFDGAETFLTLDRVRLLIGALAEMCSPPSDGEGRFSLLEID